MTVLLEDTEEVVGVAVCVGEGFVRVLRLTRLRPLLLLLLPLLEGGLGRRVFRVKVPHLGGVIGGAGSQVLDIGGQEDAIEVVHVGLEGRNWDHQRLFFGLDHAPNVDISLEREIS